MDQPKWMVEAWRLLGEREVAGRRDNPDIVALYRDAGHPKIDNDEVAWCAAFAGACLVRAGVSGTRSLMARSYLKWGVALSEGRLGAVTVLTRGANPAYGHVGFWIGETRSRVILLGGNQGDAVSVSAFDRGRLLGFRWPTENASQTSDAAAKAVFERALAHVLEMEGGFSDDRYDPGGATNFGITIGDYARWRQISLNSNNYAHIREELRHIAPETVRSIYEKRYWEPAGCAEMPAGLALMHFDAGVNHGIGTAIRILQAALGVDADGEIGPITRRAIREKNMKRTLERYADGRRRRYRSLSHFWRFGRGWLRRVDKTLERALDETAQSRRTTPSSGATQKGQSMATDTSKKSGQAPAKWWGSSLTIWGAIVTALAAVLPAIGPAFGLDITAEIVRDLGQQLLAIFQGIAALIGTIMTLYGRVRATQPLERRFVSVKL